MKVPPRLLEQPLDAGLRAPAAPGKLPTAGDVLGEIGMLLAAHLAVALIVGLVLRAGGIG
jgi:hypothetical protein